ncbi:DsbA family protein [Kutzneria sp. NPDC052558]|uniref:DsbA family protein n=1 Tax=Kutzneria sp. NPDC052558 TaxID=3364121 RepID=UPI0037C79267
MANADDRRRQAQKAMKSARGGAGNDRRWIIIGIVAVVLLAGGVIGGVIYQQQSIAQANAQAQQAPIPAAHASATYPTAVDKTAATVTVGKDDAKTTIDAYEDFLCPVCGQFEKVYFPQLDKHLAAGDLKIRYHLLNLLDNSSKPAGYSMISANTALAVATAAPDKFMDFHLSLYQKQPTEGKAGWTQDQLTDLAHRLGATGAQFDDLVRNKTYNQQIQQNLTTAEQDQNLWQAGQDGSKTFGTPTIAFNGKAVSVADPNWIDKVIAGTS